MSDTTQEAPAPEIEAPVEPAARQLGSEIAVRPGEGGVLIQSIPQMVDAAKLMARAGIAVAPHCRDNPGICFAVLYKTNALNLKDPFFVAEHSYPVMQRKKNADGRWESVETLAYDSTIFHAAVEVSGILRGPLRCEYEGEGEDRRCTVYGTFKSEKEPHALQSPRLGDVHPGHTEKDGVKYVKGSPLWDKDPDQQLFYWTVRNWARRYCPHVVGGIYDKDEFEETPIGPDTAKVVSPNLLDRLPGKDAARKEGFDAKQEAVAATAAEPRKRRPQRKAVT